MLTVKLGAYCHSSSPELTCFMCYHVSDVIQGLRPIESITLSSGNSAQVVVATNCRDTRLLLLIGVNAPDRPGLLLDISKGLLQLSLQLHHTEAAVVGERSVSVWRCEHLEGKETDIEEIQAVLSVRVSKPPLFGFTLFED